MPDHCDELESLDPAEREDWLRAACGEDDALRVEVTHLLARDEQAERVGFLMPPKAPSELLEATGPWPSPTSSRPPNITMSS